MTARRFPTGRPAGLLRACMAALVILAAAGGPPQATPEDDASARLTKLLETLRAEHKVPALAAAFVRAGKIEGIGAVGVRRQGKEEPVTVDDRFHIGSDTKAMTATLAALLVEEGKIRWTTTVAEALPDLAKKIRSEYAAVTLEQLLWHRSGVPGNDRQEPAVWAGIWGLKGDMLKQRREAARLTLGQAPVAKPGEETHYSNLGYMVAGVMLESATGEVWEDLMRKRLFGPLGMKTAGFGSPGTAGRQPPDEPWGHEQRKGEWVAKPAGPGADNPAAIGPAGTVHCSIGDLARWAALHLAGARGEKGLLLPPEAFKKLHTPPPGADYAMGWGTTKRGWAAPKGDGPCLTHAGSNTMWFAVIWIAPERDAAFVAASNCAGEAGPKACDQAAAGMIREFLK